MQQEVLSLKVMAALRENAPTVVVPDIEAARALVKALAMYAAVNKSQNDQHEVVYWRCALSELIALAGNPVISPKQAGTIFRAFQLVMKRENDGYKVAWSAKQLEILNANLK